MRIPLSRSIFSATSAPVSPPGKGTRAYLAKTDCKRACTIQPTMPITIMRIHEPIVPADMP